MTMLWGGYGNITSSGEFIRKQVKLPDGSGVGHERKKRSYIVERHFYKHYKCEGIARVKEVGEDYIVMQDLSIEYPLQFNSSHTMTVIKWLARFHRTFWNDPAEELWPERGYWYLSTRMEEYASLDDEWKVIAVEADARIKSIPEKYLTIIHGDAKSANMLFNETCVMYDFQYVGRGPGVRDVVYFLISSVPNLDEALEREALQLYASYFDYPFDLMMQHYNWCLIDYHRFMLGWGLWGNHRYSAYKASLIKHDFLTSGLNV